MIKRMPEGNSITVSQASWRPFDECNPLWPTAEGSVPTLNNFHLASPPNNLCMWLTPGTFSYPSHCRLSRNIHTSHRSESRGDILCVLKTMRHAGKNISNTSHKHREHWCLAEANPWVLFGKKVMCYQIEEINKNFLCRVLFKEFSEPDEISLSIVSIYHSHLPFFLIFQRILIGSIERTAFLIRWGLYTRHFWLGKTSDTPTKQETTYLKAGCRPFHTISRKHVFQPGNRSKTFECAPNKAVESWVWLQSINQLSTDKSVVVQIFIWPV